MVNLLFLKDKQRNLYSAKKLKGTNMKISLGLCFKEERNCGPSLKLLEPKVNFAMIEKDSGLRYISG